MNSNLLFRYLNSYQIIVKILIKCFRLISYFRFHALLSKTNEKNKKVFFLGNYMFKI